MGDRVSRRNGLEQGADRQRERPRQTHQHVSARIGFPQLDPPNVLVVQSGALREPFLRQLAFEAQTTELCPERAENRRPRVRLRYAGLSAGHTRLFTAHPRKREPSIVVVGVTLTTSIHVIRPRISRTTTARADQGPSLPGHTPRDVELVADLHQPGSDALAVLFNRYIRLVYRVAVEILRDEAEAEDVAQDVFLEIYRKAHQYDPSRGPVKVWLLQYAYHRSLRRKEALRRRAAYRGEVLDTQDASDPADDGRHGALTRQECRWMIHTGLALLPERQRTTLELACLQELSLRDVADRLRVSVGCARHYYYRGLRRLRAWAQVASVRGLPTLTAQRLPSNAPRTRAGDRPRLQSSDRAGHKRGRGADARARHGNLVALEQTIELVPRQPERDGGPPAVEVAPFERGDHLGLGRQGPGEIQDLA